MTKGHLTVPEQNVREYAYELAYRLAREQLTGIDDIEQQCRRSGAKYIPSKKIITIEYLKQSYQISLPEGEVSLLPEPVGLVRSVPEDYVSLLLEAELPRRDQHDVPFPDPVPLLHLTPDPAHPPVSVLADDLHAGEAQVLVYHAQYVVLVGHEHSPPDVALALYQFLTHYIRFRATNSESSLIKHPV